MEAFNKEFIFCIIFGYLQLWLGIINLIYSELGVEYSDYRLIFVPFCQFHMKMLHYFCPHEVSFNLSPVYFIFSLKLSFYSNSSPLLTKLCNTHDQQCLCSNYGDATVRDRVLPRSHWFHKAAVDPLWTKLSGSWFHDHSAFQSRKVRFFQTPEPNNYFISLFLTLLPNLTVGC